MTPRTQYPEQLSTSAHYALRQIGDDAFARSYLKADTLVNVIDGLFSARRQAGLTQEQVAEKTGHKQAVIARWEAETDGSISLHRYVDFVLACGFVPQITLVPFEQAKHEAIRKLQEEEAQTLC